VTKCSQSLSRDELQGVSGACAMSQGLGSWRPAPIHVSEPVANCGPGSPRERRGHAWEHHLKAQHVSASRSGRVWTATRERCQPIERPVSLQMTGSPGSAASSCTSCSAARASSVLMLLTLFGAGLPNRSFTIAVRTCSTSLDKNQC
jgi:hypothetical protein